MGLKDNFKNKLDDLVKVLVEKHQQYDLTSGVEDQDFEVAGQDIKKSVYYLWIYSKDIPNLYAQYLNAHEIFVERLEPKPVGDGEKHTILFNRETSEEIPNFHVNRVDITIDTSKHRSVFAMLGNQKQYPIIKEQTNNFFAILKNAMESYSKK